MTASPVCLFVNPAAGRGRAARRIAPIRQAFDANGVPLHVIESRAVGDLEDRVADSVRGGAGRIVVVGGDGSIHEAVNGILRANGSTPLGIIPSGTGNDFAKACGISLNWEHAAQLLAARIAANATPRSIDVGRMNERFFANGVGIGFDAKVTRVARSYRWRIGDFVYLLAVLRCMYDGVPTPEFSIRGDTVQWQDPVTMVSVSNGPWVGGMFHIAPMASNADGLLDLLIAAPVSRMRLLALLPKLIRGVHIGEAEISHHAVGSVTVETAMPVESHLDGEVQPLQSRFQITLLPGALNLL